MAYICSIHAYLPALEGGIIALCFTQYEVSKGSWNGGGCHIEEELMMVVGRKECHMSDRSDKGCHNGHKSVTWVTGMSHESQKCDMSDRRSHGAQRVTEE